jgi:hypothetical protein
MRRTQKGYFEPKNPQKLLSGKKIIFRSSWERKFMEMCDNHPNIIQWASEHPDTKIPYYNPVQNKHTIYVPDFFVVYKDKSGHKRVELVEVKPAAETYLSEAKSPRHKTALAINVAKWKAAQEWCQRKGIKFRVITEFDIFNNPKKKR